MECGGGGGGSAEGVGVAPVDVDRGCGERLAVESRDDGEAGAGAAERPEEIRTAGRGDGQDGAVGKDNVELNDAIGHETPQAGTVAEAAESGVAADTDGGTGSVRETR